MANVIFLIVQMANEGVYEDDWEAASWTSGQVDPENPEILDNQN